METDLMRLVNSRAPLVVVSISRSSVDDVALATALGADAVEIRVDLIQGDARDFLSALRQRFHIPLIVTNRCAAEGGGWKGGEEQRVKVIRELLPLADAVDIELASPLREAVVSEAKRLGKTVIISSHDFKHTPPPSELKQLLEAEHRAGGDISKLAVTPLSPRDVLNLLQAGVDADFPVCVIAMGKLGRHTRVIGGLYGSVLTYASLGDSVAPGQLRVDALKNIMKTLL
jgi:3-dehydroquinate dehydratase-1